MEPTSTSGKSTQSDYELSRNFDNYRRETLKRRATLDALTHWQEQDLKGLGELAERFKSVFASRGPDFQEAGVSINDTASAFEALEAVVECFKADLIKSCDAHSTVGLNGTDFSRYATEAARIYAGVLPEPRFLIKFTDVDTGAKITKFQRRLLKSFYSGKSEHESHVEIGEYIDEFLTLLTGGKTQQTIANQQFDQLAEAFPDCGDKLISLKNDYHDCFRLLLQAHSASLQVQDSVESESNYWMTHTKESIVDLISHELKTLESSRRLEDPHEL